MNPLNRSQTDSNIHYPYEDLPEASGAAGFVSKEGGFDFHVLLEALHSVLKRPDVCSVRVCETSLSVLELLLDLGVVSGDATAAAAAAAAAAVDPAGRPDDSAWKTSAENVNDSLMAKSHGICIDIVSRSTSNLN